ncbi:hypothetical protein BD414DRAFT_578338 [Trametes punicea]|nr:hypothetical protein BD414DRAFT_578338 [Trametes punicea]
MRFLRMAGLWKSTNMAPSGFRERPLARYGFASGLRAGLGVYWVRIFPKPTRFWDQTGYGLSSGLPTHCRGSSVSARVAQFETNFWAASNVSKEAVKFFREVNAPGIVGRLIEVSSKVGVVWPPSLASNASSKSDHARRDVESLAAELDPTCSFRTEGLAKVLWLPKHPAYSHPALPVTTLHGAWDSIKSFGNPRKEVKASTGLHP